MREQTQKERMSGEKEKRPSFLLPLALLTEDIFPSPTKLKAAFLTAWLLPRSLVPGSERKIGRGQDGGQKIVGRIYF